MWCGNKQRPTKWEKAKAVYSELAIARVSATVACVLAETLRQAEKRESFIVEKKGDKLEALEWGCYRQAN